MLEIKLATIADAANISREGKLNITGIFNNIKTASFPASHPCMVLVYVIEGDISDAQATHKLKVDLIDEDGNLVIPPLEGKINFKTVGSVNKMSASQIIQLANVQFKKHGRHAFKIILNGEVRATVPLEIIKIEKQQ